jgi:hypothetical protein
MVEPWLVITIVDDVVVARNDSCALLNYLLDY